MSKQNQVIGSDGLKQSVLPGGCIRMPGDKNVPWMKPPPKNQPTKCPMCNGKGSINTGTCYGTCGNCHGTGHMSLGLPVPR